MHTKITYHLNAVISLQTAPHELYGYEVYILYWILFLFACTTCSEGKADKKAPLRTIFSS
jgi:hypothetical protein